MCACVGIFFACYVCCVLVHGCVMSMCVYMQIRICLCSCIFCVPFVCTCVVCIPAYALCICGHVLLYLCVFMYVCVHVLFVCISLCVSVSVCPICLVILSCYHIVMNIMLLHCLFSKNWVLALVTNCLMNAKHISQ